MMRRVLPIALALAVLCVAPAQANAEKPKAGDGLYVRFEPMIIPVFSDGRVAGLMSVTVNLQVKDEAAQKAIEAVRPKFIDAMRTRLAGIAELWVDPRRPINVTQMRGALQQAIAPISAAWQPRLLVVDASVRATN